MVSFNIVRLTLAGLCLGQVVFAAPVGDASLANPDVNKRWDALWIIYPKQYEDAVDENGNPTASDAAFDLSKAVEAVGTANAQAGTAKV